MSGYTDGFPIVTLAPIASQIALVIGAAWMLERLLSRRPAAARHSVWLIALFMTLLSPATQAVIGRAGIILATVPATAPSSAPGDRIPSIRPDESRSADRDRENRSLRRAHWPQSTSPDTRPPRCPTRMGRMPAPRGPMNRGSRRGTPMALHGILSEEPSPSRG